MLQVNAGCFLFGIKRPCKTDARVWANKMTKVAYCFPCIFFAIRLKLLFILHTLFV